MEEALSKEPIKDLSTYVGTLDPNYSGLYVFGVDITGLVAEDILTYCTSFKALLETNGLVNDNFIIIPTKGGRPFIGKSEMTIGEYVKAVEKFNKKRGVKND